MPATVTDMSEGVVENPVPVMVSLVPLLPDECVERPLMAGETIN